MKYAGIGLKSVQKVFPGLTDRQANELLHALAGFVYTLPLEKIRFEKIKGDMTVSDTPYVHPSSPRREDYEREGVIGGVLSGLVRIDLDELEDDLSFEIEEYSEDNAGLRGIASSLTKNINHNFLKANNIFSLSDVYAPLQNLIEAPYGYEVKQKELYEYSYEVKALFFRGEILFAKVRYEAVYDVYAEIKSSRYFDDDDY